MGSGELGVNEGIIPLASFLWLEFHLYGRIGVFALRMGSGELGVNEGIIPSSLVRGDVICPEPTAKQPNREQSALRARAAMCGTASPFACLAPSGAIIPFLYRAVGKIIRTHLGLAARESFYD
jgi:hypothetical protein